MDGHVLWHLPRHRRSSSWELLRSERIKRMHRTKDKLEQARKQEKGATLGQVDKVAKGEVSTKVGGGNLAWNGEEATTRHPEEAVGEGWYRSGHKDPWEVLPGE